ncbi:unnamed protein product [Dibothriocephalus latus]|uniref:HMG box domain-containing protein n=1 Tax=Dibothriocephalus latus TaxID=60516 RepID=A0A3P7NYN2_DIBLA|nr:unnamed protein product [Dibothriocephalus latus]
MARLKKSCDPNAPARPRSSFNLYMSHRISQSEALASKPFGERNRMIGLEWAALPPEQKQIFNEQASREREKYKVDFEAYKQTQSFKDWQAKQEGLRASNSPKSGKRGPKGGKRTHEPEPDTTSSPKTQRIPIFSEEFLAYNRQREMTLRNLRKQATQLEEETALLSKHVENLANASTKLEQQIKSTEAQLAAEEALTQRFRKELTATFAEVCFVSLYCFLRPCVLSTRFQSAFVFSSLLKERESECFILKGIPKNF